MSLIDPTQAMARILIDELARAGVRDACISPGSRSTPLVFALEEHPAIATHVVIDERSAAFLALGIAKASRNPAIVLSTSGTAAANLHPAVIEAHEARTPLIVLTADRPPELRSTGADQTIDQIKLFGDAVRFFCEVGVPDAHRSSPGYWRSLASRSFAAATGSPAGPVHLNLAFREPLVPSADAPGFGIEHEPRPGPAPWTRFRPGTRAPSPEDVETLAELVRERPRGLVVAGPVDVDPEPVLAFAAAAGYPVIAEPASNMRSGGCALSAYDALLRIEPFVRAHVPDVVVRLGKPGLSKGVHSLLGGRVDQVLVDPDGAWLDPGRSAGAVVACDPAGLLGEVAKALPARTDGRWLRSWRTADATAQGAMDEVLDAGDEPSEPRSARDLARTMPNGATLVVGASMPVRDLEWFMPVRDGLRVIANRGANGIDGTVSTALGVALASGGHVAALLGDLALLHDQNGLLVTRSERVSCVFVVLNNDGGGIFNFLPQAKHPAHFERLFGTPHGVDLGALAAVYGCRFERVERASELPDLVGTALATGGTHILEVRTHRVANVELHRRAWSAAERAVSARATRARSTSR